MRPGTSIRPRLDFSTDSTLRLVVGVAGGDQGDPGDSGECAAAQDEVHRIVADALAEVHQAEHGRAGFLGELAERFQRGADFAVAVGVDPAVHHRCQRVEHQQGDVVRAM